LTLKDLFKRKRVTVRFGEPVELGDIKKTDEAGMQIVEQRLQTAFDQLDKEIDPNFHYEAK
ncbi:MAG: 1-acyl-sn-glycerol-3-phosphate acyltransferase, partial [Tetragenococcus halophilus]|nr:1-acyl-sn-glycerol-3-phosphate acyltransferase [Tetragenococcus halophilus]MDN6408642.1 1-acyl-sn-glycerol-3-phosphate acyltransferase [Tetragenococcus halophilus]